jgi:glycosyltransferase involved in cell wall biosynthesis
MKILMLSSRYEPYATGGAERAARTLVSELGGVGHEVVVLTVSGKDEAGDRVVDGVRVRAVPLWNIYDLGTSQPAALKPFWHLADAYNPAMQAAVSRVIAEERPDIVHTQLLTGFSASAWTAARGAGVPIVHTLHDHYVLCARSQMSIGGVPCAGRHLECVILTQPRMIGSKGVTHVVGVSRYILDWHRSFNAFAGVPGSVIPNPCHLVGAPVVEKNRGNQLRFGFMASLHPWKGIEPLIDAMGSVPADCALYVAGAGEPGYVEQLHAAARGRNITFVGVVDPASFLRDIDVMVVPSTGLESFGLSAAEALAIGVPVIASNRGALPELVKPHRTGWIFDASIPGALASLMNDVAGARDRIPAMSVECRQSVQGFRPDAIATSYGQLYESVARRP